MKKITSLALSLLAFSSLNADISNGTPDKYRASLGSLPGVSGFQNAYLTDQKVSGEGATSEAAYMNFDAANSGAVNLNISGAAGYTINEDSTLWGEMTYGFGDATTIMLSAAYQYEIYKPTQTLGFSIVPRLGYALVSQDMGVVPTFNGQINTDNGDFNSGESIKMNMQGAFIGLAVEADYKLSESFSLYGSFGFGYGLMGSPDVTISEKALSGDIFAKNCTGNSSQNLACSDYFNPFEEVAGLTGITFQVGAQF